MITTQRNFIFNKKRGNSGKIILLSAIVLLLFNSGCKSQSQTLGQAPLNTPGATCPDKPVDSLDTKNVKQIQLTSQPIKESSQLRAGKDLGYTFEAQSGQRLNIQTNDEICIWVYTPDNQIITGKDLTQTGKYIIQISVPKGLSTFDLQLALESSSKPIYSNQPTTTQEPNISTSEVQSADTFVRNHYIAINNRQYSFSYKNLSPRFINENIPGGYSDYQRWWDSVKEIKIGEIKLLKQNNNQAIVNAELWYTMNDGKTFQDSKSRIDLVWSNDSNKWLFDMKSEP
ncbi:MULTISPECIES: hypothetical protein [unclassified Tolypothrix]|uniref:hypothetical protein n=1 Tax=unclassified Tolypothrix TaxID=2649714 RepID=UPI0005EABA32|nr:MULTISPECIES: hypothetical protein [unclassified Tolypothrix]BAY95333.1 hypothetical protein NIES3275_73900 [Microchaete diplosiphon NIES-3275]EKE96710.1 hypothetical protein FDUTEX481_06375 [Tolypothrix sp. PCC 7601]MBE9084552.1 hypothetical protein [Tolypothrix sp. LEGE 11397]UYD30552.1 hypothetical protein HGR01_36830 [Tolypothrix sp. PCC 7712]UYD38317.1 hypothetical protein HG267_38095 [Tolypothrix sp. PCC 7601]